MTCLLALFSLGSEQAQAQPPTWLVDAMKNTKTEYPDDRVELILRTVNSVAEWRVRCLDCPGKVCAQL